MLPIAPARTPQNKKLIDINMLTSLKGTRVENIEFKKLDEYLVNIKVVVLYNTAVKKKAKNADITPMDAPSIKKGNLTKLSVAPTCFIMAISLLLAKMVALMVLEIMTKDAATNASINKLPKIFVVLLNSLIAFVYFVGAFVSSTIS